MTLNAVGIVLVVISVTASVSEIMQGRFPVPLTWFSEPGMLEAGLKTAVMAVLIVGLYVILARPAPAKARVQNDQHNR